MPSSVIATMRYDSEQQILTIIYRNHQGRYLYFGVPPEEWEAFRTAKSKGTYLNEVFKQRGYRYEKIASKA